MKLKPILFSLSVLILSFAAGVFIFAWTEPSLSPPEGNVPTPINVGAEPQAKAGRISATEFGDSNNPSYFLNPEGNSLLGGMTETNTLGLTPRFLPDNPQESQLYWDSETHKPCYYNGSEWIYF